MPKITKEMTIEQIMHTYPETLAVFKRFGLECNGCQIASFEKIEHGASVHKVDVDELLAELNKAIGD